MDTPDPARVPSLLGDLLQLADAGAHDAGVPGLLRHLTERSLQLPGVQAAGVLPSAPPDQLSDVIASNQAAERLERLQIHHQEGPCRDAVRGGRRLVDLPLPHPHCQSRWPHFTPQALAEGFTAITAVPVRHQNHTFGALNLFHQHRHLEPADIQGCQALADATALGLAHHRTLHALQERNAQLETALTSRIVIEQAKGILTERLRIPLSGAFDRMRRHARSHQQKLTDLADQIIQGPPDTGPFPRPPRQAHATNGGPTDSA